VGGRKARTDGKFDVFVSHAKKLGETEDRAVWVADVVEGAGIVPFFDRSDLLEITEPALKDAMLRSDVCVTVLDPFTFNSLWVFKENLLSVNAGIPIVPIYDADRFRWDGQLDKLCRLYPWVFGRQVVPLTKTQRRTSVSQLLDAITTAKSAGRVPPKEPINAVMGAKVKAKVGVGGSRETQTRGAVDTAHKGMLTRIDGQQPSLIICGFTCTHPAEDVANRVHELSPMVPMIGCTSCRGVVLNDTWLTHQKEYALGLWGIMDDAGAYITVHIQERPPELRDQVFAVLSRAIQDQGMSGEEPSFAIILGSPGDEEIILGAMQDALGEGVPIMGGSSADNQVLGKWAQCAKQGRSGFTVQKPTTSGNGITVAVGWASCQTASTLTSGFNKTSNVGKVTLVDESDHGRTMMEIDGEPVGKVYDRWTKGALTKDVPYKDGIANVLASSSFRPLGEVSDTGYVRVLHPAFLHKESQYLTTFADSRVGMNVTMLDAAPESLAKLIADAAKGMITDSMGGGDATAFDPSEITGAFMIFCGGLVMAIDDSMPMAAEQLAEAMGQNNTMGVCCFGEQGMDDLRRPTHGNLMFGCLLFSNKARGAVARKSAKSGGPKGDAAGGEGQYHDL
jgi:hypothetical protein